MRKIIIFAVLALVGCSEDDSYCQCNAKYLNLNTGETHIEHRDCDKIDPVGEYDVFVECVEPSY